LLERWITRSALLRAGRRREEEMSFYSFYTAINGRSSTKIAATLVQRTGTAPSTAGPGQVGGIARHRAGIGEMS
jgi:hypothetical protein